MSPLSPQQLSRIEALFTDIPADGPGCQIGLWRDGRPLLLKGFGLANIEQRVPITPETRFRIASNCGSGPEARSIS